MIALMIAGISIIFTFVFAFAKTSSRAEKITASHREELMARKKDV